MEAPSDIYTPPAHTEKTGGVRPTGGRGKDLREMKTLDWIHFMFLAYSGAHNTINAWHRSNNFLFFVFILVGILSVELMLFSIYKHWKDGRLVGKMLKIGKYAGFMAMFYATAGILAQAQTGSASEWLTFYYQWILPTSAPMMFAYAFWIQSVDPIMTADRDQIAYAHMIQVDLKREKLDQQRMELDYRGDIRKLKRHLHRQKLAALWKESNSRRTRSTLKQSMLRQMPIVLRQLGVNVDHGRKGLIGSKTYADLGLLGEHTESSTNGQAKPATNGKASSNGKSSLT